MDPVADISLNCTNEEVVRHLERMMSGSPVPSNVTTDVNPYIYNPSNLPDGIWYLIRSEERAADNEHGLWTAQGEAREIFSNSSMIGWMTTLEFYEGQVPHGHMTDWVMQEFRITERIPTEHKAKEAGSLCRVFRSGRRQSPNHEEQQNMSNIEESGELVDVEILPNDPVENPPEIDYPIEDNYLELMDLINPISPSSSSECSSCLTLSSEESFDPSALLQELESENNRDLDISPATSDGTLDSQALERGIDYSDEASSSNYNYLATSSQRHREEPDSEEQK